MKLVRFLSYPVYFNPESARAVAYVMEHFWAIRSRTRSRRLLKRIIRPSVSLFRRRGKQGIIDHPRFERLRPFLDGGDVEVVIDARRFRSQERNRADALQRLVTWLRRATLKPKKRVSTKPGKGVVEKRLQSKRQRSRTKQLRGSPDVS